MTPDAIFRRFAVPEGEFEFQPLGNGHINSTYLATASGGRRYVLQQINTAVFRDPEALMANFVAVTRHLEAKFSRRRAADPAYPLRTLAAIPTREGNSFLRTRSGECWRCCPFIAGTRTVEIVTRPEEAYQAAAAFGAFQRDLADLPERLQETIADFHHTPKRLAALERAVRADARKRAAAAAAELDFIFSRAADCSKLTGLLEKGELVERTIHNDTKVNNVLLDERTGAGCCVIDLDTVMPGLALCDFGDLARSCVNPSPEDAADPSQAGVRQEIFAALVRGYLDATRDFTSPLERELLPFAVKLMALELAIRFLTDFLEGDGYFRTVRPGQNLDRTRVQLALVREVEAHYAELERIVRSCR